MVYQAKMQHWTSGLHYLCKRGDFFLACDCIMMSSCNTLLGAFGDPDLLVGANELSSP